MTVTASLFILACGFALGAYLAPAIILRWRGASVRRNFKPILFKPYRPESLPDRHLAPSDRPRQ